VRAHVNLQPAINSRHSSAKALLKHKWFHGVKGKGKLVTNHLYSATTATYAASVAMSSHTEPAYSLGSTIDKISK